ncbi:MAG: hypothetical protein KHZ13_06395 [Firmicutes bacterium]|jgi:acyl carrier protein|nr:hypothetical protein [Bacillota bacterium]
MEKLQKIQNCLEENGIEVLNDGTLDNVDSISFISSIVSLEEEFNIEFPDEYLLIEKMNNINNICLIIESLLGS